MTDEKQQQQRANDVPDDPQVDARDAGPLYEVLTQDPSGHRTVHRLRAADHDAAEEVVVGGLREGAVVLGAAVAPSGLGSGDPA